MARKLVIFVDKAQIDPSSGGYREIRYDFGEGVSAPESLFGVALFRWLCGHSRVPDDLLVVGTRHSSWDALHELASLPADHVDFAALGLARAIGSPEGVRRAQLDGLQELLGDFLTGVRVQCALVDAEPRAEELESFMAILRRFCSHRDRVYFELPGDRSHLTELALEATQFVRRVFEMRVGGMYHAGEVGEEGIAPVTVVETSHLLADWSLALASFRRTGSLGRILDICGRRRPRLRSSLEELNFALLTARVDEVKSSCERLDAELSEASAERPRTTEAMVYHDLRRELAFLRRGHPSDWQLELARRALANADWARAARMISEAIVTAAIADSQRRGRPGARREAERRLLDPEERGALFPIDPGTYHRLHQLRRALVEGERPDEPTVLLALRGASQHRHFLERAIEFAEVVVEHMKSREISPREDESR